MRIGSHLIRIAGLTLVYQCYYASDDSRLCCKAKLADIDSTAALSSWYAMIMQILKTVF